MVDRQFNEIDLRRMLEHARGHRSAIAAARFVIDAWHDGRRWEVIVEPEAERQLLVIITAYPVEKR